MHCYILCMLLGTIKYCFFQSFLSMKLNWYDFFFSHCSNLLSFLGCPSFCACFMEWCQADLNLIWVYYIQGLESVTFVSLIWVMLMFIDYVKTFERRRKKTSCTTCKVFIILPPCEKWDKHTAVIQEIWNASKVNHTAWIRRVNMLCAVEQNRLHYELKNWLTLHCPCYTSALKIFW